MEPEERDDGHGPKMVPTSDYDGFTLHEWMWSPNGLGLALTSPDLMVYAKIYSVSHHNSGAMTASQPRLAQLFNLSRETVNRSLRKLVDDGLVYVCGTVRSKGQGERPVNVYSVCQVPINRAIARCRSMAEANQLSQDTPSTPRLFDTNVIDSHVHAGESDRQSHSNVTNETNVTDSHIREKGSPSAETQSFQQPPLITKTNPDPRGEAKRARELTETEFLAFRTLLGKSLKPVPERYVEEARDCFASCIDEGIPPELILTAYGRYARQLIANRNAGRRYHPMSLTHFLMRNRRTDEGLKHNTWIEDEINRAKAEAEVSERPTRLLRDSTTGHWIAFAPGHDPEYVPGVGPGASEAEARAVWDAYAAEKQLTRTRR